VTGPNAQQDLPFHWLMLAAFEAGMAAGADRARDRASNPWRDIDEPGDRALSQKWLDGFNRARRRG
jgi:hypothetical protein